MTGLSAYDIAAITGVTYRRLDYWCRLNILAPARPAEGSGSRREFDRSHVKVVMALDELMIFAPGGSTTMRSRVFEAACAELELSRRTVWAGRELSFGRTDFVRLVLDLGAIERAADEALADFAGVRPVRAS